MSQTDSKRSNRSIRSIDWTASRYIASDGQTCKVEIQLEISEDLPLKDRQTLVNLERSANRALNSGNLFSDVQWWESKVGVDNYWGDFMRESLTSRFKHTDFSLGNYGGCTVQSLATVYDQSGHP